MTDRRRCTATRKDGQPCQAWASKKTGLCPLHSPDSRQIQVMGGQSKTRQHMLETRIDPKLMDVVVMLGTAARQVHQGELSPAAGSSIASIATALIKAMEVASLEMRVTLLEVRSKDADEFGTQS